MGQYKTEAILLAVRDFGDADRMVTLFSREFGKLTVVAYGARRPKSSLSGTVQPFIYADISLTSGKNLDSIRQCDIRQPNREVREDLIPMAYANFLAELVVELWPEREAEPAVFDLLLAAFKTLPVRNPRITTLAAAWQLLALAGFRPEQNQCVSCNALVEYPACFDPRSGGAVCRTCASSDCLEYTEEMKNFLERLLSLDWEQPGHFSVNGAVLMQTEGLLRSFLTWHLDRPLKSLAFISAVT